MKLHSVTAAFLSAALLVMPAATVLSHDEDEAARVIDPALREGSMGTFSADCIPGVLDFLQNLSDLGISAAAGVNLLEELMVGISIDSSPSVQVHPIHDIGPVSCAMTTKCHFGQWWVIEACCSSLGCHYGKWLAGTC